MRHICIQLARTRIGDLILGSFDGQLCLLDFQYRHQRAQIDRRLCEGLQASFVERSAPLLTEARDQIEEYLAAKRLALSLPLLPVGNAFQQQVWAALMQIEPGTTTTYRRLAESCGGVHSVPAIASACGANALALCIPCHRVLADDGAEVGYGGGIAIKRRLLKLERDQRHSAPVTGSLFDFG